MIKIAYVNMKKQTYDKRLKENRPCLVLASTPLKSYVLIMTHKPLEKKSAKHIVKPVTRFQGEAWCSKDIGFSSDSFIDCKRIYAVDNYNIKDFDGYVFPKTEKVIRETVKAYGQLV